MKRSIWVRGLAPAVLATGFVLSAVGCGGAAEPIGSKGPTTLAESVTPGSAATGAGVTGSVIPVTLTEHSTFGWSGEVALVVGGDLSAARMEVARFDPSGDSKWSSVASPPFEHPLFSATVQWVGSEFLVSGVACSSFTSGEIGIRCAPGAVVAALYSPKSDTWLEAPGPFDEVIPEIEVNAAGTSGSRALLRASSTLMLFEATSRSWTLIESPLRGAFTDCFVGDAIFSAGEDVEGRGNPEAVEYSIATGRWSQAVRTRETHDTWVFSCVGSGLAMFGHDIDGSTSASLFVGDGTFSELPKPPSVVGGYYRSNIDDVFVIETPGGFARLRGATESWTVTDTGVEDVIELALIDGSNVLAIGGSERTAQFRLFTVEVA